MVNADFKHCFVDIRRFSFTWNDAETDNRLRGLTVPSHVATYAYIIDISLWMELQREKIFLIGIEKGEEDKKS